MEYSRKEVDALKTEANPQKLLSYIDELEQRLLKMYTVAHQFCLQATGEGLPMPATLSDVLYKKEQ